MNVRHNNRGDVKEGGCPFCKPRHKREEEEIPYSFLINEGLDEYDEEQDG